MKVELCLVKRALLQVHHAAGAEMERPHASRTQTVRASICLCGKCRCQWEGRQPVQTRVWNLPAYCHGTTLGTDRASMHCQAAASPVR